MDSRRERSASRRSIDRVKFMEPLSHLPRASPGFKRSKLPSPTREADLPCPMQWTTLDCCRHLSYSSETATDLSANRPTRAPDPPRPKSGGQGLRGPDYIAPIPAGDIPVRGVWRSIRFGQHMSLQSAAGVKAAAEFHALSISAGITVRRVLAEAGVKMFRPSSTITSPVLRRSAEIADPTGILLSS